jgi:ATP-dependent Clp protease adaptor protein ClpS
MKVTPGMTVDITMNVMQEAHVNGPPVVIICPQSDPEGHCLQLQRISLLSSIELNRTMEISTKDISP